MKQFILAALLLISTVSFGQDKHQCEGTTRSGEQCKHKTEQKYCKVHDPATPRCGADTKAGGKCRVIVKQAGERCHNHKN
jgi:hypothetical protein